MSRASFLAVRRAAGGILPAALLLWWSLPAQAAPGFDYRVDADPSGYRMRIEMRFSRHLDVARAVAALRDPFLLHELFPEADPLEIHPLGPGRFESTLRVTRYFKTIALLSRCEERWTEGSTEGSKEPRWSRRCELDPSRLGADRFNDFKLEEIACQPSDAREATCSVLVSGRLKDYLFFGYRGLTARAKAQGLENWAKIYVHLEAGGGVAPAHSLRLFERSGFPAELERFRRLALQAADAPGEFRIAAEGHLP